MADFTISNHGSILVLWPQTDAARDWCNEHLNHDEVQHWGRDGVVVEPRYIDAIVDGFQADGLTC